jgi:hypothetical protein
MRLSIGQQHTVQYPHLPNLEMIQTLNLGLAVHATHKCIGRLSGAVQQRPKSLSAFINIKFLSARTTLRTCGWYSANFLLSLYTIL